MLIDPVLQGVLVRIKFRPPGLGRATIVTAALALAISTDAVSARSDRDERLKQAQAIARPTTPLNLIVSIKRQHISVWDGVRKIAEAPISSGMSGHETPTGVFSIIEKNKVHFSNLYNDAPMPFMQRLTWSGVALHAGALPGYPASHGCIRLPYAFAKELFELTRVGARVVVARDDVEPRMIAHPKLPVPLPPAAIAPETTVPAASARGEAGTIAKAGTVDMLFGVRAAAAGTGANVQNASFTPEFIPQRTRASVIAARAAELSSLADAVAAAEIERDYAEGRAKDAALDAHDSLEPVERLRNELKPVQAALETAQRSKAAAEARLTAFVARNRSVVANDGRADDERLTALGREEDALETLVHSLLFEIEDLDHELGEMKQRLGLLLSHMADLESQRRDAVQSLAAKAEALKQAQLAKTAAERAMQRRNLPITMFVSRKSGKLIVRQGFEPLFDAAVKIDNPEAPLGTHVFTALDYAAGERQLNWNVVSVATAEPDRDAKPARTRTRDVAETPQRTIIPQTASASLARIRIPDDVLERLAEYVKPGSTFMISDVDLSNETGKGTDVVLLTRQ